MNWVGGEVTVVEKPARGYLYAVVGWTIALRKVAVARPIMMWSFEDGCTVQKHSICVSICTDMVTEYSKASQVIF